MRSRGKAATIAPIVGVIAAMVFTATIAATWVDQPLTRSVGDVAVTETHTTAGMELAPVGLVVGLAAVLCGLMLLATRGRARRIVALLLAIAGSGAAVAAAVGVSRAMAMDGRVTVAAWVAVPAAVAVVAAGVLGLGPTERHMPARYDVDVAPGDREWQLATDPGDAGRLDKPAS